MPSPDALDPVQAYDRLAASFSVLSEQKQPYLERIDELIISRISPGSRSLLDVGAGNGRRAEKIARARGLKELVLLEPSAAMSQTWPPTAAVWQMRAEDFVRAERRFDVITCLWNVLGHIRSSSTRIKILVELKHSLSLRGRLFIDVNHRYNARAYGVFKTVARFLHDQLEPNDSNGDVDVSWPGLEGHTYGHVFTDGEFVSITTQAGLAVEERIVVDYKSGKIRRFGFEGNLLYVLRPQNSASDSLSASQTSSTSASFI